jgi:hypothetical protein
MQVASALATTENSSAFAVLPGNQQTGAGRLCHVVINGTFDSEVFTLQYREKGSDDSWATVTAEGVDQTFTAANSFVYWFSQDMEYRILGDGSGTTVAVNLYVDGVELV